MSRTPKRKRDDSLTNANDAAGNTTTTDDQGNGPSSGAQKKQKTSTMVDVSVIHGPADIAIEQSSEPQNEFPYWPLNAGFFEIRVVTLKPGPKSTPIECRIDHVRADRISNDSEAYNAISYTWGSPNITRTICLDGITVQVRENLWQVQYVAFCREIPISVMASTLLILARLQILSLEPMAMPEKKSLTTFHRLCTIFGPRHNHVDCG